MLWVLWIETLAHSAYSNYTTDGDIAHSAGYAGYKYNAGYAGYLPGADVSSIVGAVVLLGVHRV